MAAKPRAASLSGSLSTMIDARTRRGRPYANGGLARGDRPQGCGHDGQRLRVAHMPTAATADAASCCVIERNWSGRAPTKNPPQTVPCAGPVESATRRSAPACPHPSTPPPSSIPAPEMCASASKKSRAAKYVAVGDTTSCELPAPQLLCLFEHNASPDRSASRMIGHAWLHVDIKTAPRCAGIAPRAGPRAHPRESQGSAGERRTS